MARATLTRKRTKKSSRRRSDEASPQKIHDLLLGARGAEWVNLVFKDGRSIEGAIIFNEYKGTGRVINIKKEISVDFRVEDLRDVKF